MADFPYSIDDAKKLLDKGAITDDQYQKISGLLSPSGTDQEYQDLKARTSGSPFASTGSPDIPDDELKRQAQISANSKAQNLIESGLSTVKNKARAEALNAEQRGDNSPPPSSTEAPAAQVVPQPASLNVSPAPQGGLASDQVQLSQPTEAPKLPPELQKQLDGVQQGYEMQQTAAVHAAQAGMSKANAEAAYLRQTADNEEKMRQENAVREESRQRALDEQTNKFNQAVTEFSNMKVDPNRYWNNKDTGDKVLAGIGLFLGAFGRSDNNKAVKAINDSIQKDIDAQKADIEVKGKVASDQRGIYRDMLDRFKDTRQAEEASRVAYLNNAQLRLQSIASQYSAPELKAKAEGLFGQLEVAKNEALTKYQAAMQVSPAIMNADNLTRGIMQLPEKERTEALKERGIYEQNEATKQSIDQDFNNLSNVQNVGSRVGSPIQSSSQAEALSSSILSHMSKFYQRLSEPELELLKSNLPKVGDNRQTLAMKKQVLQNMVQTHAEPTPTLTGFNLIPKPLAQRIPSLKKAE